MCKGALAKSRSSGTALARSVTSCHFDRVLLFVISTELSEWRNLYINFSSDRLCLLLEPGCDRRGEIGRQRAVNLAVILVQPAQLL